MTKKRINDEDDTREKGSLQCIKTLLESLNKNQSIKQRNTKNIQTIYEPLKDLNRYRNQGFAHGVNKIPPGINAEKLLSDTVEAIVNFKSIIETLTDI